MSSLSTSYSKYIVLAEDDENDCFLFKYALEELSISFTLTIVHNGEELMQLLNEKNMLLPDFLFLDLNMPRKNGFECLMEIKCDENLKKIPVIIFSTSFIPEVVRLLYKNGARYYIRKPDKLEHYKKVIYQALTISVQPGNLQPPLEKFVLAS